MVTDVRRDYRPFEGDHFALLLDTFDDDRNAFVFGTNPRGAKREGQMAGNGESSNFDWDGVWYVKSKINARGWQAEMAIPFKTLRFREGERQVWGLNLTRKIRRKNEDVHWSPIPRPYRINRVSLAGELDGISRIRQGRNLYIKPYVSMPLVRREQDDVDFVPEAGLDVKYGVTPGFTLDLTVNTDFAQVEADEQQINLTRFSLFFPEKREFFLENASIFEFGKSVREWGASGRDVITFFSRRSGIVQGQLVPILGGARLSGTIAKYRLGLLSMQADEFQGTPSTNFSIARVRRDIFRSSNIGGIFINKQVGGGRLNRTYGMDTNLKFDALNISSFVLKTDTSGIRGKDMAGDFSVAWKDRLLDARAEVLSVQENFNPEVGFVPRKGIRKSRGVLTFKPRPGERIPWIREFRPSVEIDYITDQDNVLETRTVQTGFAIELQNSGVLRFGRESNFERLEGPFRIRSNQSIPVGDYQFEEYSASFSSDRSRMFSGTLRGATGSFWDGDRDSYRVGFRFQPSYQLRADVSWTHDDIDLPSGAFTTNLVNTRLSYSFNTSLFLNALIQYNSTLREIASNIRFNFIYKPLSDLFLVYNERRATSGEVTERALIAKVTYIFGF
ncbi:carbohydrate binding family 9 domain-containing protein [Acidobacteria bacterium AH-259-D05]|nr:carbohydrate binding family 9 domain-containing protein [Acidobacteria bacterium AH-259-D05]